MVEERRKPTNALLHWLEKKNFISLHAFMLYVTTWMTWEITVQAWKYAFSTANTSGLEAAAVIGAVTVPFAALQGFVFKIYSESRR